MYTAFGIIGLASLTSFLLYVAFRLAVRVGAGVIRLIRRVGRSRKPAPAAQARGEAMITPEQLEELRQLKAAEARRQQNRAAREAAEERFQEGLERVSTRLPTRRSAVSATPRGGTAVPSPPCTSWGNGPVVVYPEQEWARIEGAVGRVTSRVNVCLLRQSSGLPMYWFWLVRHGARVYAYPWGLSYGTVSEALEGVKEQLFGAAKGVEIPQMWHDLAPYGPPVDIGPTAVCDAFRAEEGPACMDTLRFSVDLYQHEGKYVLWYRIHQAHSQAFVAAFVAAYSSKEQALDVLRNLMVDDGFCTDEERAQCMADRPEWRRPFELLDVATFLPEGTSPKEAMAALSAQLEGGASVVHFRLMVRGQAHWVGIQWDGPGIRHEDSADWLYYDPKGAGRGTQAQALDRLRERLPLLLQ